MFNVQRSYQGEGGRSDVSGTSAFTEGTTVAKVADMSDVIFRGFIDETEMAISSTFFDISQIHQQWFAASENALRMKYERLIRKRILDIQVSTDD